MVKTVTKTKMQEEQSLYKKLYEGVMSSIPSSILIVDDHLRVVSANPNFYVKGRRTESNTLGKDISMVFPKALLDYTKMPEKIRMVFQTGEPFEGGEMEYRAPGLPTRVYYYRLTPLMESESSVESLILLMDDVTERKRLGERIKRTEEHLAQVVDSANDIILSTDRKGKILSWNNTIEIITGLKSNRVMGKPFSGYLLKEDQKSFLSIMNQLLRRKRVKDKEFSIINKDSEAVDILWSFSAMKDEQGEVIGLVIVGHDLTERKELQAKLTQSAKMASLGTMAGGIAHEIRNPLAIIDSSAQILKKYSENEEIRSLGIEKIRNATKRAADIVDNLLQFAHQSEFAPEELDTNKLIESTFKLLENQLSIRHVIVKKNYSPVLPAIYGNKNQLQQVWINLILNACNAMSEGGTITVRTTLLSGSVGIMFEDTGEGVPDKSLSRIFDPFFTTQPVGQGTGLGLSISFGIVEQHGGTIGVMSQKGKGSTFTVSLPVRTPPVILDKNKY